MNQLDLNFIAAFKTVQQRVHENSVSHGFWDGEITNIEESKATKIALMHSELSETLEAVRKPDQKDKHLPHVHPEAVELADAVIRIMDYAEKFNIPVADAIILKADFNESRPRKHGKLF